MKLKPYPKYKPSGVEWLGDVPEHWEALTVRRRATRIQTGGTPPTAEDRFYEDGTVPWFGPGSFDDQIAVTQPIKLLNASAVKEGVARMFIKGATMVVTIGATLGKVSSLTEAGSCNQQITVIEFDHRRIHPRFATYQLKRLEPVLRAIAPSATLPILDQGEIADIALGVPSLPEQRSIAAFLDRETSRIDRLVVKKRELIERLKEKRTALISRTVTRGLPPAAARAAGLPANPPLKPSGIDWLGEIPEHWEVKKFGYISIVVRGASPRPAGDARYFDGDFIPWITVGEVTKDNNVYLNSTSTMLTEEGADNSRIIRSGTLVLTNSGATLGVPKILAITGCANDGVVAFESLSKDADRVFHYYYLRSLTENLRDRIKQGSGQPNLNTDIVKALSIPFPPLLEQVAIATYLDIETAKLDALVAKVEEAIERLQEYRTALITAAVTGKIDVREESTKDTKSTK